MTHCKEAIITIITLALILTITGVSMAVAWQHDQTELRKCTYTVSLPSGQEFKGLYATQLRHVFLTKDNREIRFEGSYVTIEEKSVE